MVTGLFTYAVAEETNSHPKKVAIFVSREIKPYLQAAETLNEKLEEAGGYRLTQIVIDDPDISDPDEFREKFEKDEYDLVVTVGTEASRFIANYQEETHIPVVYTMLLYPENIFTREAGTGGVSLNIPVESQLREIQRTLPNTNTIAVLYDPQYNSQFVDEAITIGKAMNLKVEAVPVGEKTSIPAALSANWHRIEALWLIPDRTVTSSDSINQYIIKEALLRKVPIIGFNRPLYNYGAALALILDYEKIGRQTADIVIDSLQKGVYRKAPPAYDTAVNLRVLKRMGIDSGEIPDIEPELP